MKHIIVSRLHFQKGEEELMDAYIEVSKQTLIPRLHEQTIQNFIWGIVLNYKFEDYIKERLDYPFISFYSMKQCREQLTKYDLQTRHDIDDWMHSEYVERIQYYASGEEKVIHAQPVEILWPSMKEKEMGNYHELRTSMFLSLYNPNFDKSVLDTNHGKMGTYIGNVIKMKDGLVKWIQHENTISQNKRRRGNGCFTGTDYGINKLKR